MPGPLEGVRVLELAGIGPAPYTCMLLSQLGADVLRVDRPGGSRVGSPDLLADGRPTLTLDLKSADDVETLLRLAERADVLVEGFRPGVAERLGIGPDECIAANPRLVYARMTGWGQDGPLADQGGHGPGGVLARHPAAGLRANAGGGAGRTAGGQGRARHQLRRHRRRDRRDR